MCRSAYGFSEETRTVRTEGKAKWDGMEAKRKSGKPRVMEDTQEMVEDFVEF